MAKITKWRTPYGTETTVSVDDDTTTKAKPVEDVVNHPNHYAPNGVDSFMHMKDQMGKEAFDFHLAFEAAGDELGDRHAVHVHLIKTLSHAADHFGMNGKLGEVK